MDASLRYDFDRDFRSKDWYKTSLSQILDQYVKRYKSELGDTPSRLLQEAAISVFCHESRINLWMQGADISRQPLHPDLGFVRNGYAEALKDVISFFEALSKDPAPIHSKAVYLVGLLLLPLLKDKLKLLDLEYNDRVWYYSQLQTAG
ncbi:hypothetical protein RhiJN_09875 [Ceratobasidium sp. AG-Ba]|nr:hypothetical protein RhiJN_09875 [Ceratobasidium sp. AG-Ba]QRW10632.1 hypothetical protein RhiLY_09631 [Ceratobasidium sp. AG-Ba]